MKIEDWGTKVVEKLAHDSGNEFPGISEFSLRNLRYMRKFAESYPDINFATAVAKLPWGYNITLLKKFQNNAQQLWYAKNNAKGGKAVYF